MSSNSGGPPIRNILIMLIVGMVGITALGWATRTLDVWWHRTYYWFQYNSHGLFGILGPLVALLVIGGVLYGVYYVLFGKW